MGRDLANCPAPSGSVVGGTLQIAAGGDYATDTGAALVKKLILRRLTTRPGEFFHLPDYGFGLKPKGLLKTSDRATLKKQIAQQILLEPEVESVDVAITTSPATGSVTITFRARLRLGTTVGAQIPLVLGGTRF